MKSKVTSFAKTAFEVQKAIKIDDSENTKLYFLISSMSHCW